MPQTAAGDEKPAQAQPTFPTAASGDERASMTEAEHSAEWSQDRYGIAPDPTLLPRLAELLGVPTPPRAVWRAATVTLFATDPDDITGAYLQHIQDIDWPAPENALLQLTITLLQHRVRGTSPDAQPGHRE